jgi:hypothetical protein
MVNNLQKSNERNQAKRVEIMKANGISSNPCSDPAYDSSIPLRFPVFFNASADTLRKMLTDESFKGLVPGSG